MAHFAEIDKNNKVIRVVTACNLDVQNNGGDQLEQAALHFQSNNKLSENGEKWIQTSYNNNFRKQYAGIGYTFDSVKNKFIAPQPFASWSLDANDDWQAPVAYPTVITYGNKEIVTSTNSELLIDNGPDGQGIYRTYSVFWNEIEQKWIGKNHENKEFEWIPSSSSWVSIEN